MNNIEIDNLIVETLKSLDHSIHETKNSTDILSQHPESKDKIKTYIKTLSEDTNSFDYLVKTYLLQHI